jgi:hypothetical protein
MARSAGYNALTRNSAAEERALASRNDKDTWLLDFTPPAPSCVENVRAPKAAERRQSGTFSATISRTGFEPWEPWTGRRGLLRGAEATERPEVEQEQGGRKRDEHRLCHETDHEEEHDGEIANGAWGADVSAIGPEARLSEERRKDILALRDPDNRLDVERVQGEEQGDRERQPPAAGHPGEGEQQEKTAGDVKAEVAEVKDTGAEAEELDVGHEGQPGEGDPVPHPELRVLG